MNILLVTFLLPNSQRNSEKKEDFFDNFESVGGKVRPNIAHSLYIEKEIHL
jgi:hypothetical protein